MDNAVVVMTEKDAVKCRGLSLPDAWYLPVDARLPQDWEAGFLDRIRRLTGDAA